MSSVRSIYQGALETLVIRRALLIREMENVNMQIEEVRREAKESGIDLCVKV